jgi:hypothetical protein
MTTPPADKPVITTWIDDGQGHQIPGYFTVDPDALVPLGNSLQDAAERLAAIEGDYIRLNLFRRPAEDPVTEVAIALFHRLGGTGDGSLNAALRDAAKRCSFLADQLRAASTTYQQADTHAHAAIRQAGR